MMALVLAAALTSVVRSAPAPSPSPRAPSAEAVILASLPAPLRALKPGLSRARDVTKALGAPAEKEKDLWRYDLGGGRFDTTIQFERGVVSSIYHRFRSAPSYAELEATGLQGKDAGDPAEAENRPHDVGREREASYASSGMRLRYRFDPRHTVTSVVLTRPR